MMSDPEEDPDPVVQEVDVYLSKQLADHLYLFQYPVRPAHITYNNIEHLSARIKPQQKKVELELSLDVQGANYAGSKGEQIAFNVDGREPGENPFYRSNKMDKQVLSSVPLSGSTDRYVVGHFRDGELHLTPVRGVVQLKPGFSYLDKGDKLALEKEEAATADSADEQDEAKPVMIKFARHESDEAKARRLASYEHLHKQREDEKWVEVLYHKQYDSAAEAERELLWAGRNVEYSQFHLSQPEYLKKLIPDRMSTEEGKPAMPSNVLSMTDLKTMNLVDQVKALLISAKVIQFGQLMSLLPKGSDTNSVIRFVQQVAILVQGCWVVKSEILYPKDTFSAYSGVPAETLCRGRDYMMWRFTQSRYLMRKDIASVIKLPAEDVKDMLEQMARLKVNHGWEFLLDTDQEFIYRHSEVMQRQCMLWDAKFHQLAKVLNITKADLKVAATAAAVSVSSPPKRRRTISRSRHKSGGDRSMSDMSDTDGEVHVKQGRQRKASGSGDRKRRGSGQGPFGQDGIAIATEAANGSLVSPSVPSFKIKSEPRDDSYEHVATVSSGTHTEMSSDLKVELMKFVSEKLRTRYVLTSSELWRLFQLKLAECPPGHILGNGVTTKILEQIALEVGGYRSAVPALDGGAIFVANKLDDGLDHIREFLLEQVEIKPVVKFNALREKAKEFFSDLPSNADLRKILREVCQTKSGNWYLKGTLDA